MPKLNVDKKYAVALWIIEDVLVRRPDWTDEQAAAWLEEHEDELHEAMVESGSMYLDASLGCAEDAEEEEEE